MNLSPETLALLMRIMQKGQQRQPQMPMQRMGVQGMMPQARPADQQFQRLPHWIGVRG